MTPRTGGKALDYPALMLALEHSNSSAEGMVRAVFEERDRLREQVRALSAALVLAEKFIHALPRPDVRKDFSSLNHMENGVLKPIRAAPSLAAAESPERAA